MPSEVINLSIRTFLKPLSFLPAILLMYMIFSFSAQEGEISSTVSYKVSHIIVETADHVFDMGMDDYQISYFATKINSVTRKLAHMTEYFLLAIAVSFPLYVYGLHGILLMILAGGICIAFACGDEYHQSFVAGRAASMKDVGIDSIGVFIGIILVRIIGWTGRKTIFRPRKEEYEPQLTRKEKKRLKAMQQEYSQPQSYGQYPEEYEPQLTRKEKKRLKAMQQEYSQPQSYGQYPPYGQPQPYGQSQPYRQSQPYNQAQPYRQSQPYNQAQPYRQSQPYDQPQPYSQAQLYRQPQPPQYMGKPEHSSDELSEDMPLSHLLKPKK